MSDTEELPDTIKVFQQFDSMGGADRFWEPTGSCSFSGGAIYARQAPDKDAQEALEGMPQNHSARSLPDMEALAKWYNTHSKTIRRLLQERT